MIPPVGMLKLVASFRDYYDSCDLYSAKVPSFNIVSLHFVPRCVASKCIQICITSRLSM